MCKLTFLSENYVNDADLSIITGVSDSQFPLDNIKDLRTTKVFRSSDNTVELLVDLGVTQNIDSFAIVGSSTDGLGFTALTIKGSGSTDFTGSTPINIDLNQENNFGFKLFTEVNFRYWKLEFTGTGGFTEVSKIFLGKKIQFEENSFSQSSFRYVNNDNSRVSENEYEQPFVDIRTRNKTLSGTIQHMNRTEFDLLNEIFNRHGIRTPLWILTDPEGLSATDGEFLFSIYGRFARVRAISSSGFGLYNASLQIKQVG